MRIGTRMIKRWLVALVNQIRNTCTPLCALELCFSYLNPLWSGFRVSRYKHRVTAWLRVLKKTLIVLSEKKCWSNHLSNHFPLNKENANVLTDISWRGCILKFKCLFRYYIDKELTDILLPVSLIFYLLYRQKAVKIVYAFKCIVTHGKCPSRSVFVLQDLLKLCNLLQ